MASRYGVAPHTQRALEVDEITLHKHTPRLGDRAKITNLMRRGARLAVDTEKTHRLRKVGPTAYLHYRGGPGPSRSGNRLYLGWAGTRPNATGTSICPGAQGFIAQGSETGFGKMYARGINDEALVPGEDRFVQVVSCNTHNLAVLIATLALHDEAPDNLLEGRFVCMRRSSDISQEKSFIAAPEAGAHKDGQFGTHHARDAWHLFQTRGFDLNLFSSVIKLNTQYMHSIWFNLRVQRPVTLDDVIEKLAANPYVALTHKIMAGPIFSFGRDHGYFGRLLNQTVVSIPTLTVRDGHEITGFCFTLHRTAIRS